MSASYGPFKPNDSKETGLLYAVRPDMIYIGQIYIHEGHCPIWKDCLDQAADNRYGLTDQSRWTDGTRWT